MSRLSDNELGDKVLENGNILVDGLLMELARGGATGVDELFVRRVMESIDGVALVEATPGAGEKMARRISWWTLVPLAAAASLTMVAGVWWFSQRPVVAPTLPLGLRVAEVQGSGVRVQGSAGKSAPVVVGMEIRQGDRVVVGKGGKVGLKYDGEETTIELLDASEAGFGAEGGAKRVNLAAGTLVCSAAPQPADRPMLLATPQAEAKVLGTRFTLEADAAATRIEVTDGLVRMTRATDKASVDVAAGHKATVFSSGADLQVEPIRALGVLLELDFEDQKLPEGTTGTVVEGPRNANSRFCVAGVWDRDYRLFRVNIRNGDRPLFTCRDGSVLSFDYWVKKQTDAIDVYFWNATRSVSPSFTVLNPAQEQWTRVAMRLSDFKKESRDGDIISDLTIQTTPGGNELFVDNIRIETKEIR